MIDVYTSFDQQQQNKKGGYYPCTTLATVRVCVGCARDYHEGIAVWSRTTLDNGCRKRRSTITYAGVNGNNILY